MIHDKDYIIRIVKQFSELLASMMLGKSEGKLPEEQITVFDTQMRDVFKMTFDELSAKTIDELTDWVESKDQAHHIAYYELLGNLFFQKFKENPSDDFAERAKVYYERWLQRSQIFSLPVMARLGEVNEFLNEKEN